MCLRRDFVFDYLTNEYYNIHFKFLFEGAGSYLVFVYLKSDPNIKQFCKCVETYLTSGATASLPLWTMEMSALPDGRCFKRSKNIIDLKMETFYEVIRAKCKGAKSLNEITFYEYPFLLFFKDHQCVDCLANPKEIKKYLMKTAKAKIIEMY